MSGLLHLVFGVLNALVTITVWELWQRFLPTPKRAAKRREHDAIAFLWDRMEHQMAEHNGDEIVLDVKQANRDTQIAVKVSPVSKGSNR